MTSSDILNDIQFADDSYDNAFGDIDPEDNFFNSMYDSCLSSHNITPSLDRYNSVSSIRLPPMYRSCVSTLDVLMQIVNVSIEYVMSLYYLNLGLVIILLIYPL